MAVSRTGRIAISDGFDDMDNVIQITDADSTFHDSVIYPLGEWGRGGRFGLLPTRPYNSGGVKWDFDGNLYVGSSTKSKDHVTPAGFENSTVYRKNVGAVYKFPATGGSIYMDSVRGALKVYSQGLGAFSGDEGGGTCRCRSPRFDLDPYGRLFIPNGFISQVTVADNSGNDILKFGEYANADSKGPGSLVPGPAIPLATPQCVAASDNYIYVTDWNNARLVRVKMKFALDNMPGLPVNTAESATPKTSFSLTVAPNPVTAMTRLTLTLNRSAAIRIDILDVSGRKVCSVADQRLKTGSHVFGWNGCDGSGRLSAAGVYLAIVSGMGKTVSHQILLLR